MHNDTDNTLGLITRYHIGTLMGVGKSTVVIPALILITVVFSVPSYAQAQYPGPHIGIILSESCIKLLQEKIPTTCPTYEELLQLDSSIPNISGGFQYDDNGLLYREKSPMLNSYRHFQYDNYPRIFVDPPHRTIPLIIIHPNFDTYTMKNDMFRGEKYESITVSVKDYSTGKTTDHTVMDKVAPKYRVLYHDRYIEKCWEATLNSNQWQKLIADTIFLMRNNCNEKYTSFNSMELIEIEPFEFNPEDSAWYQHMQWVESVKRDCIFKYHDCSGGGTR